MWDSGTMNRQKQILRSSTHLFSWNWSGPKMTSRLPTVRGLGPPVFPAPFAWGATQAKENETPCVERVGLVRFTYQTSDVIWSKVFKEAVLAVYSSHSYMRLHINLKALKKYLIMLWVCERFFTWSLLQTQAVGNNQPTGDLLWPQSGTNLPHVPSTN